MSGVHDGTDSRIGLGLQPGADVEKAAATVGLRLTLASYSLAFGSVLLTFGFCWWLKSALHEVLPALFFIVPVVITAWRAGLGPSLFATALSLLLMLWFFIEPRFMLGVAKETGWLTIGGFLCSSLAVCWLTEKLHRANLRAEDHAAQAKARQQLLMAEIEARRGAEETLSASERHYRAVIEATPNLLWMALPDGSFDFVSTQWEQYTGVSAAESLGNRWTQLIHPEDRDRGLATWSHAVKRGEEAEFDFRLRGRGGSYRWFKTRAVPLRDPAGRVDKWFGTCTDVTLLMEARETLAKSHEELEQRIAERTAEVERLKNQLQAENYYLREKVRVSNDHHRIVGQSQEIRRVLAQAEQVAVTDATVLLLGETGTGKELLAEMIHELSARRGQPLVGVNCAAMPGALVESELFGREKGAFTGSLSRQIGRFEMADRSTIFLDEVGELSLEVQAKLLRVLEARQIERLGNPKPIAVDVRIIAATNRNLEKAVSEGKFRQDLYYRLNVFPITVPPLRNRSEDIPLLVWAFVDEYARRFNKDIDSIERESMDALQRHSWPGNIRELRNLIERAMIVANGPRLRIQLPAAATQAATPNARKLEEVEREHMLNVLEDSGWRVRGANGAAAKLGLKPTTLEARMAKLGIRRPSTSTA